jgi:hypothetical protein
VLRHGLVFGGTLLAGLAVGGDRAAAIQISHEIATLFSLASVPPPTATQMTVCYGFVCRLRTELYFTPAHRKTLTDIMAKGRATPEAERRAVQHVVVWFDRQMGPVLGTTRRVPRADFRHRDDDHNYDCHDTTRNTVSLLLILQAWGVLRHHTVGDPRYRGNVLVGQTPHNTAVLVDRTTGRGWVVDMWTTGYAQEPDVMPVERWLKED